jgi:hypothetical protein
MLSNLISIVVLFAVDAQEHTVLPMWDRSITLADVRRFGVNHFVAHQNYLRALSEAPLYNIEGPRDVEILLCGGPQALTAYRREAHFNLTAWTLLNNVFTPRVTYECGIPILEGFELQIRELYRLREHLGYEAFYAGWMPPPFPNIRPKVCNDIRFLPRN